MNFNGHGSSAIIFIALFFAILWIISIVIRIKRHRRRTYNERFSSREELSENAFYETFYSESQIPKNDVWKIISLIGEYYAVPPGTLRPTDTFLKELAPPMLWGYPANFSTLTFDSMAHSVTKHIVREYPEFSPEQFTATTVDDVVRNFAAELIRCRSKL